MCYVMGGAELHLLEDNLPEDIASMVEVKAVTCLNMCDKDGSGNAPYAKVGDVLITKADLTKVKEEIARQIEAL